MQFDQVLPWTPTLPNTCFAALAFQPTLEQVEHFRCYGILLPTPLQRAVAKRQAEYLAGRLCARQALLMLNGRPHIPLSGTDRAPKWPNGIVGSITHSNGQAAALVAHTQHYCALGLDLEPLMHEVQATHLQAALLTPDERQRWANPSDPFLMTLSFSLKESLFKALYPLVGRYFYFHDAELVAWQSDGYARLRLLSDLSAQWHAGCELEGRFTWYKEYLLSVVAVPANADHSISS